MLSREDVERIAELEAELDAIKRLAAECVHADAACRLVYVINTAYATPGAHWRYEDEEGIRRARAVLEATPNVRVLPKRKKKP